jgi:hypothetical protein
MLSRHLQYRSQRLLQRQQARTHSLSSIFGLSDFDERMQWRIPWDFDTHLVSGVTISFDGSLWVESWRLGALDDCFQCGSLTQARDLAVQEVPNYLSWRLRHTGSSGRTADVYLPRDPVALSGAEAVIAIKESDNAVRPALVPPGERAFSQRVRTAADMLFWAKPMAPVQIDLSEQQLADGFVHVGTVRDCGHLALAPDALRLLSGDAPRSA